MQALIVAMVVCMCTLICATTSTCPDFPLHGCLFDMPRASKEEMRRDLLLTAREVFLFQLMQGAWKALALLRLLPETYCQPLRDVLS